MSDYTKSTNFASKDSLSVGNPLKIVKGTEIDTEFNNIATAVATKADIANPTFTGVPSAPTASAGTSTAQVATTAFVAAAVTAAVTAYDSALTVSTSQIENDAVTADKIATGAVGNTELASNAVTQAKIADNAVGTAEIIDANVTPTKLSQPFTSGTFVATTSRTTVDFTGIPSWAKRITVILDAVSLTGTANILVQLGSGSITSTGYASYTATSPGGVTPIGYASTAGFIAPMANVSMVAYGTITLHHVGANAWVASINFGSFNGTNACGNSGGGLLNLGAVLDRVRITTSNGTDTFDAGGINIFYE